MIGRRLNHYKIVAELGRGGMGQVYLAEDTRLKRRVAQKTLQPAMASDPDRRARVWRPRVWPLHDRASSEGRPAWLQQHAAARASRRS